MQARWYVGELCSRLQCDGPPRGYRGSALRSWCRMPARVDQGGNSEHACSTRSGGINGECEIVNTSTYISCHFRITFLFINSPGVLRGSLNRTGHLSRYCLIRSKRFGTNRGIDRLEVIEKAFRDSPFGCRGSSSGHEKDTTRYSTHNQGELHVAVYYPRACSPWPGIPQRLDNFKSWTVCDL